MNKIIDSVSNKARVAFLEALQSSIWNRPILPVLFDNLTREDWSEIFRLSFHQTVEGHVADAVSDLPENLMPPQDILLKWIVSLQRIEDRNLHMRKVISKLGRLFKDNHIRAILQKGHGVSLYYEKPEIRHGGDIDWFFITKEDYRRAGKLISEMEPTFRIAPAYSSDYIFEEIVIEHHQRLIQLSNPFLSKYINSTIEELSRKNIFIDFEGEYIEVPSPLLNIIQVNAHILRHQVGYGIGLRQLCDSARLYYSFFGTYDGLELKQIYKNLGILGWINGFHKVLIDLIGLDEKKLPFPIEGDVNIEWMKEYIIKTGNFGFYDPDNPDIENPGGRVNRSARLFTNFRRFFPIAPGESLFFPIVHVFSKVHH